MAGNPFRRPGAAPHAAQQSAAAPPSAGVAGREATAELSVDTSDSATRPKKVVKRVRIQSPVISPDEPRYDLDPFDARSNEEGHPGSPPPTDTEADIAIELRKSFIDSVARGSSNLNLEAVGDVPPQTQKAGLGTETMAMRATQTQARYNPFSKTLASIEGGYGLTPPPAAAADDGGSTGLDTASSENTTQSAKVAGKAAMDVHSFTRMLLTGKPVSSAPSATLPPVAAGISTDGTSTENSSISRQSLSEPILYSDSPRSSYEESPSDAETAEVNEQTSLVGDAQPKKAKPPPPVHHRGKLLSKKGPQVVSFAEFDASLPSVSAQQSPILPNSDSPRPGAARQASDTNKPLPPPPVHASPQPAPEVPRKNSISPLSQAPLQPPPRAVVESQPEPAPAKLRPPPPPVSRRGSQIRIDGPTGRPRSGSNLSRSSIPDDYHETPSSMTTSPVLQPTKPAPPPSRRVNNSISSADRDGAPHTILESAEPTSQASTSKAPPPPPSRQTLRGAPSLTRTPSTQSTSSIGHRRVSPSVSQAPPPPPPRRGDKRYSFDGSHLGPSARRPSDGGGSQRSSIELLRRSSGASINHARTPSISSLHNVPEGEAGTDASLDDSQGADAGKDILADLSAFQAEIDALRAQIGK